MSLVRQQAHMLVDAAELILKEKGRRAEGKQGINIDAVREEIRRLEVTWKYQDVYEKILLNMGT